MSMTQTSPNEFFIPADNSIVVPEGGNAEPLPDGTKVLVTILPTNKDGSSITKRPYSKDASNANSKITALAIRVAIVAGQRGAGRNIFASIPMARKFASGATAFSFYGFFRALGYDVDGDFAYPGDHAIMGQQFEAVLGLEEHEGKASNTIKFFNKPNGIVVSQAAPTGAPRGNAAPAWTPGQAVPTQAPQTPAPGGQAAAPGWFPPGMPAPANAEQLQADAAIQAAAASGPSF